MKEKHTAQTNTKFYANTVANGMSGKKIIAQPSIRHALFAKEKITLWRTADTKKCEELKDTQVDKRGAGIFTLNTPKKN